MNTYYNMDESQKHVEWKKSNTEYILIEVWIKQMYAFVETYGMVHLRFFAFCLI